jgi:hypothetical protein
MVSFMMLIDSQSISRQKNGWQNGQRVEYNSAFAGVES